jgi:hypothetical protein
MADAGKAVLRTHDLAFLLDSLLPLEPLWETARPRLESLTSYAVVFRSPGDSANRALAKAAIADAQWVRAMIRRTLRPTINGVHFPERVCRCSNVGGDFKSGCRFSTCTRPHPELGLKYPRSLQMRPWPRGAIVDRGEGRSRRARAAVAIERRLDACGHGR